MEGKTKKSSKVRKQYLFSINIMDNWTENYYEKENNLFFEKLCCFFIYSFLEKICGDCEFRF